MKIFLHQIPVTGRTFDVLVKAARVRERLANRPDIIRVGPCRADMRCDKVDQVVTIQGRAVLELTFVCSRCADEFEATLRLPVKRVLMPRSTRVGPDDEDEDVGFHDGRKIDLAKILLEQVALMTPNVLLCDQQCRGLCPVCGTNLNNGPCRCGDS